MELIMHVAGADVPVTAHDDNDPDTTMRGRFSAEVDGATEPFTSSTWGELRARLARLAEGEVSVPFTIVHDRPGTRLGDSGSYLRDGIARAIHANRHHVVLVTWPDTWVKGQVEFGTTVRRMTPEIRAALDKLIADRNALNAAIEKITGDHYLDLHEAVKEATAAKVIG